MKVWYSTHSTYKRLNLYLIVTLDQNVALEVRELTCINKLHLLIKTPTLQAKSTPLHNLGVAGIVVELLEIRMAVVSLQFSK